MSYKNKINTCGELGICENKNPCSPNPNCDFRINQMTNLMYDSCYDNYGESNLSAMFYAKCGYAVVLQDVFLFSDSIP